MRAVQDSSEHRDDSSWQLDAAALLAELSPNTDLSRLIARVSRDRPAVVAVAANALSAWQERDPLGWARVVAWLAARGVSIILV